MSYVAFFGQRSEDTEDTLRTPSPGQARQGFSLKFVLGCLLFCHCHCPHCCPPPPRSTSYRNLKGHILHLSVVPRKLRRRGRHKTFKIIKIFRATFITYTRGKAGELNGGNNGEYAAYPFWHSSSCCFLLLFFYIYFLSFITNSLCVSPGSVPLSVCWHCFSAFVFLETFKYNSIKNNSNNKRAKEKGEREQQSPQANLTNWG